MIEFAQIWWASVPEWTKVVVFVAAAIEGFAMIIAWIYRKIA